MKPIGRNTRACQSAIPGFEYRRNVFGLQFARAHPQNGSDNRPNHVLKKAASSNPEDPFVLFARPLCSKDRSHAILDLGRRGTKRREVVRSDKTSRGLVDGVRIHGVGVGINVAALERAHDVLPPDVVFVRLGASGMTCVKLQRDLFNLPDPNLPGQERVHAPQNRVGVHGSQGFYAGDLSMCMDAGIRPPGSRDIDFVVEKLLQGFLERSLDSRKIGLDLPSMKISTVVGKGQLEVPHRFRL